MMARQLCNQAVSFDSFGRRLLPYFLPLRPKRFADGFSRRCREADDLADLFISLMSLSQSLRSRTMQSIARSVSDFPRCAAGICFFIPWQKMHDAAIGSRIRRETCE
jgi:hypothetical protein